MIQELAGDVVQLWADIICDNAEPFAAGSDRCVNEDCGRHQTLSQVLRLFSELYKRFHRWSGWLTRGVKGNR